LSNNARQLAFGPALFVLAVALSACGGSFGTPPGAASLASAERARAIAQSGSGINKIDHVVIVIQENRSLDNLFQGFPGADTQSYGRDSNGNKIKLQPISLATTWDLDHSTTAFVTSCNGTGSLPGTNCKMNGFDKEFVGCGHSGYPPCPIKHPQYAYAPAKETKPYFDMAEQYVLADKMFASDYDESSFVAHQYLIAAYSSEAVNYPNGLDWGCYGGQGVTIPTLSQKRQVQYDKRIAVCFDNQTLGDELDGAAVSWRSYTSSVPNGSGHLWNAYSAISHIYNGPDWKKDIITPQTKIFDDINHSKLPAVSWVTPTCENSDHASCNSNTGPSWVASVVNAVGKSKYWNSTAIFVVWDDPGGWYDHVPPKMLDYDGLGMRVPLLVISPYAKAGYVSHVHYELSSILRFVEDRFGLPQLNVSDARATSPEKDCFDFSQPPRKFGAIPSQKGIDYFLQQRPDPRPVDTE
jgi:phospholipase C